VDCCLKNGCQRKERATENEEWHPNDCESNCKEAKLRLRQEAKPSLRWLRTPAWRRSGRGGPLLQGLVGPGALAVEVHVR